MIARRSFLKRLAGAVLATQVAFKLGASEPKLEVPESRKGILNPAYENAQYEESFVMHPNAYAYKGISFEFDPYPRRFNFVDGGYCEVLPYLRSSIVPFGGGHGL